MKCPDSPAREEMFTTEPPSVMSGVIAWMPSIALVRLMRRTRSQSSSFTSSSRERHVMPALLTRPWTVPTSSRSHAAVRSQSPGSPTSSRRKRHPGRQRLQRILDVRGDDLRALGGERRRLRGALAARRARDEHDLAVDSTHPTSPSSVSDIASARQRPFRLRQDFS